MDETTEERCDDYADIKRKALLNSFFVIGGVVVQDGQVVRYYGERPGPGWDVHGWCAKVFTVLKDGKPLEIVLLKRRWLLRGTHTTCHSRPPDDPGRCRFCTLIVVLRIWACLLGAFLYRTEVLPSLSQDAGSDRTVQRWLARGLNNGLHAQQAIRQAILAARRVEPRPQEDILRGGRDPPVGLLVRYRRSTDTVSTLWRALDLLFVAAKQLSSDVALLLAETRRRWFTQADIFPF